MSRTFLNGLCAILLCLLGACTPTATAQDSGLQQKGSAPEVLVPQDRQRIGEENDPLCPAAPKACYKIRVEGRVPDGLTPFLGVEPVLVSPMTWIQPAIRGVRGDGSFSGLVYLGQENKGTEEYFKIYALACKDEERLHEGDQLHQLPKDCLVSEPVEVFRVR
ncbi:MAG TPA: hypothetical protein VKM72_23715 [Thermoanaerobaculia bacterium]|nr:hypothetical protein [Thermoanaerobaculia bacterium]